jgi:hypothetical protein
MRELQGKGWRVLGYFLWMLGAGLELDGDAQGSSAVLMVTGLTMFLVGAWQSWVLGAGWARERHGEEPGTSHRN